MLDVGGSGQPSAMRLPTVVRLETSLPGVPAGEPVAVSAQVSVLGGSGARPTGTVAFSAGSRTLGTAALGADGVAHLGGLVLPAGLHALVATYQGDAEHDGAASVPVPLAVHAPGLAVVVAVAGPRAADDGVVLEAELLEARSGRLAEQAQGEVVFVVAGRELARAAVRGGQARALVAEVPSGPLEAVFGGGPDHAPGRGRRD